MCAACADKRLGEWCLDTYSTPPATTATQLEVIIMTNAESADIDAAEAAVWAQSAENK